ncbi:MAG: hypothetical protein NTX79_07485 [Candidatus Micrarchaeota archaeon]|nr:hypothetical protein [Candidatus Micrarchaeota archaeon]
MMKQNRCTQHAVIKYDWPGVTSPVASVKYGPTTKNPMLRSRDALIFMVYHYPGGIISPHTSMKTICLDVPLGDVLVKDGKQSFVPICDGGLIELIQVDNRLLTIENMIKPSQIIKAESNWRTDAQGANEFVTLMLEGNDQMSTRIPKKIYGSEMFYLKDISNLLFNEKELKEGTLVKEWLNEFGSSKITLWYPPCNDVAGNLMEVGRDWLGNGYFSVPEKISWSSEVLTYKATRGDAKVDAPAPVEKTEKMKSEEKPSILVGTADEMKKQESIVSSAKEIKGRLKILSPEDLKKMQISVLVEATGRNYWPGGSCGVGYYNRLKVIISRPGYMEASAFGEEYKYRDPYDAGADDWRRCIRHTRVLGLELTDQWAEAIIQATGEKDYNWIERVRVPIKPDSERVDKKNTEDAAKREAEKMLAQIKERQKGATYPIYNTSPSSLNVPYDEPHLSELAVSTDGKYAVFIIEEMIDFCIARGKQKRWTAYKIGSKGKAVEVAEGHSYEKEERLSKIAIGGISDNGIEIVTEKGARIV